MPALDTMYSPIIDPIHAMPTLIFSMEIKSGREDGTTSFVKICRLLAPIDRISNSLLFSVAVNPFSMCSMATINPMSTVINTIALPPVPHQMIISGPKAILGRAFSTTR